MKADGIGVHSLSLDSLSLTEHEDPHEETLEDEADADASGKTGDAGHLNRPSGLCAELKSNTKQDADL